MSDPVKNVEIEDVLSSIRKLVSAGDRPVKQDDVAQETQIEKLVLTPSLRVDEVQDDTAEAESHQDEELDDAQIDEGAETAEDHLETQFAADTSDDAPEASTTDAAPADTSASDDSEQGDVWAEVVNAQDDTDPEQDSAEMQTPDEASDHVAKPEMFHADEIEDAEIIEADTDTDADTLVNENDDEDMDDEGPANLEADISPELSEQYNSLKARVARFEQAVAAQDDAWEPDGSEANDNDASPTSALPWQDQTPGDTGAVADDTAVTSEDAPADAFEATAHMAEETEGLDPFEPSDDDTDDADEAEIYAEDEPVEAPVAEATVNPGNAFLTDDDLLDDAAEAILDEETLRDLVAEIVRQELQGTLGERITRNVRKLVRREIQRALAAQELE